MYARHECCLNGTGAEAGLLVALLACLAILLQGTPDSLDGGLIKQVQATATVHKDSCEVESIHDR